MTNPNKIKISKEENKPTHDMYVRSKVFRTYYGWLCDTDLGIYNRNKKGEILYSYKIQPLESIRIAGTNKFINPKLGSPTTIVANYETMYEFLEFMTDLRSTYEINVKELSIILKFFKSFFDSKHTKKLFKEIPDDKYPTSESLVEDLFLFKDSRKFKKMKRNVILIEEQKKCRNKVDISSEEDLLNDPYLSETGLEDLD